MSKLSVWDLDGTIRPGSLLTDAILHGIDEQYFDPTRYTDPHNPTYDEIMKFVEDMAGRSHSDFGELTDRISDEARRKSFGWSIEKIGEQEHPIIISHSPDFLVKAFARGLGGKVPYAKGSYFHTKDLTFSGRAVTSKKHPSLLTYTRKNSVDRIVFAAGDTEADLPILRAAEQAVVINPTAKLAEIALVSGWDIVELLSPQK